MLKPLLVIVAVCLVCGVAWGDGKGIVITDPAFSVSMVQGVSDPGTGLCASYKVVSWKDAGLWVDGGPCSVRTLMMQTRSLVLVPISSR